MLKFPIERFDRWEIMPEKLTEMGYFLKSIEDQEVSTEKAGAILGVERSTVSRMLGHGLLKDNGKSDQKRRIMLSSVLLVAKNREKQNEEGQ